MHRLRDQMRPVSRVQFQADIFDVPLHGSWRDTDFERDLFGRPPHGDQFQDLMFAKGQMRFNIQGVSMHGAIP